MSSETAENKELPKAPVEAPTKLVLTADNADETKEQPEWYKYVCATIDTPLQAGERISHGGFHAMHAVLTYAQAMWDIGTVITCAFVWPVPGTYNQQSKVMAIVREWEQYANIRFQFVGGMNAMVRISFNPAAGNWSFVGREILTQPGVTLNLAEVTDYPMTTDNERGTVLHEFGHTLGFQHEHQSPRRGEEITLIEDRVIQYYWDTNKWPAEKTRMQVINVLQDWQVSNYSALDHNSIMMYPMEPWLNMQGLQIYRNNNLSNLDKAFVVLNYPSFTATGSGWTVQYALDVAGVTGVDRDWILYEYARQNWQGMRAWFTRWCINARAMGWRNSMMQDAEEGGEGKDPADEANSTFTTMEPEEKA